MNALGQMGGFLLPFVFIQTSHSNYGIIKKEIYNYMMMHTIVAAVCFTLTIFLVTENQNLTTEKPEGSDKSIPMMVQFKCLFSDVSYFSMFISASITFGLLGAMGNVISLIVAVWGYEEVIIY